MPGRLFELSSLVHTDYVVWNKVMQLCSIANDLYGYYVVIYSDTDLTSWNFNESCSLFVETPKCTRPDLYFCP